MGLKDSGIEDQCLDTSVLKQEDKGSSIKLELNLLDWPLL